MLIRLIPAAPHPTVLFAITFQNLPDNLPNPLSWTQQLNCLSMDDLEIPRAIHSLDKSAAIPNLVEEVSFDVPTLTVSCRFIDGSLEEWPLMGAGCLKALENVLNDVNESALETEREKEREKEIEKEKENLQSVVTPPTSVRVGRHRKQRSLLMTLVASLVPSSTPSPPSSPQTPTSPPSPANTASLATLQSRTPSMSPRALRRRARSTLVDTFRLHVLTELTRRLPQGGYYTWVIQSMLRRASDRLAQLVQQAGGQVPDLVQSRRSGRVHNPPFPEPTSFYSPSPFYSDDDDGEGSEDTDTDGSSIHTPSSSHFRSPNGSHHAQQLSSDDQNQPKSRSSRTSFSPLQTLSSKDLAEYTAFSAMTLRLRQLFLLANARNTHTENEMKHHESVLEIRSRRRAWLNKSLVGGARGGNRDVGLAMPFQSSRLGQCSWSDEDFDVAQDEDDNDLEEPRADERIGLGLGLRRTRCSGDPRLFPVSEEEEDEAFVTRELELEFGSRLEPEGGMGWRRGDEHDDGESESGVRVALEIERPKIRPRVRTSSMHWHRLDVRAPVEVGIVSPARPQSFSSSSILCQPLTIGKSGVDLATGRPPAYAEVDVDVAGYGYVEEEFTLAMDLPYSVRVQDREGLPGKRKALGLGVVGTDAGVSVGAGREHECAWLTSGLGQGVIVDCR